MNKKMIFCSTLLTAFGAVNAGPTPSFRLIDGNPLKSIGSTAAQQPLMKSGPSRGSLFFEDFELTDPLSPDLPDGWSVVDLDGLTPSANVSQFTAAWIADEDPDNIGGFNIQSTSSYDPPGQSNDWVISPAITLTEDNFLYWKAKAGDPNARDGYKVHISTTTQTVSGCNANIPVFSVLEENGLMAVKHQINLDNAGYANQTVYICFHNNSTDQNILMLDDIEVKEALADDVKIDRVSDQPPYTKVPDNLNGFDIPLVVDVSNVGGNDQIDLMINATIKRNGVVVDNLSQMMAGPLVSGAIESIDLGPYTATIGGTYEVEYSLEVDGVADQNPSDNLVEVQDLVTVTAATMSKDNELEQGSLGIGAGDGGYLGNEFEFDVPVTLAAVNLVYSNDNCDPNPPNACALDGESTQVDVFAIDEVSGLPGVMVASTAAMVIPNGPISSESVTLSFSPALDLAAGAYVFAVVEPVRTVSTYDDVVMQLGYSVDRYRAGTTWVTWPSSPNGAWLNSEDLDFEVSYLLRLLFDEPDVIFQNGFDN